MFSSGVVEQYKCFLVELWNSIDVFQVDLRNSINVS